MTESLARLRADVTRGAVVRAIQEYDRLGAERFFAAHGFGPSRSYELVWDDRRYPHKAILGTAYGLATGQRLGPGDFEGGKSVAVAVIEGGPYAIPPRCRRSVRARRRPSSVACGIPDGGPGANSRRGRLA